MTTTTTTTTTRSCYKTIQVSDVKSDRDRTKNVIITTINVDGVYRYWTADFISDFKDWWNEEDYGGPSYEDELVEFILYGSDVKYNMAVFGSIVEVYF